jgi:two-component system nitrogen regulation response regulator GlnG
MQEVYKAIGRVAPMDLTVLILGESGTGKELVARAIYQHSRRSGGPFLAINCAAIPENFLESELFGHEKGSFTGAERQRLGKFEQCSGGTLFLDEIGDMSPVTQTKILRLLQEQQFERVGGSETIRTDVRLIAATHRNLPELAGHYAPDQPAPVPDRRTFPDRRRSSPHTIVGQFRHDLYFRLSGITITLPPLRERGEDLGLLVEHFIRRFNPELGREVRQVEPTAMRLLEQYRWPGNVRELQGVIRQALLVATGPVLLPDFLPHFLRGCGDVRQPPAPVGLPGWEQMLRKGLQLDTDNLYADALALMERDLISRVLNYTEGNQQQAAKILGISRLSVRRKIQSLGIRIERSVVRK